jgi:hypothetical protein
MDQLQAALDTLESRNEGIHQEMLQLLQSNREIRRGINSLEEDETNVEEEPEQRSSSSSKVDTGDVEGVSDANESQQCAADRKKNEAALSKSNSEEDPLVSQLSDIRVSKNDMNVSP